MIPIKKLAVFCGSSTGCDPLYTKTAMQLGNALSERGIALVYGGTSVGLMGTLADTMLARSSDVFGVMLALLIKKEIAHTNLTELFIVNTVHERKALMTALADGFVLLPGGIGSLDEFFDMLACLQLGYHHKPIGIVNIDGYYDAMLAFLDHAAEKGFMKINLKTALLIDACPKNLIKRLCEHEPAN